MQQKIFEDLSDITFLSSELCNLNCSYCEIAKNVVSDKHVHEQEEIRKALASGEYVNRYKAVFNKYQINAENIMRICLWGQEPTLTLNEFATQIPDILTWLKNANQLFFSTNGVAYYDRIINLVHVINNFSEKHDREFRLVIQFSLDSIRYNEKQRGINPQVIVNNIAALIKELNNIKLFSKFHMDFNFHGVLTFNLMHMVLQDDNVKLFWEEMDNTIKDLAFLNTNEQIVVKNIWGTGFQHPYNATSTEGKELAEFVTKSLDLYRTEKIGSINPRRLLSLYIHGLIPPEGVSKEQYREDICDIFNYQYDTLTECTFIKNSLGCGVGSHDIKMRYDGTLIYCQNLIHSLDKEVLAKHEDGNIVYDIQKLQLKNNFQPNFFTSPEEDIYKFIYTFDTFHNCDLDFTIIQIINLMYILLKNHQIDESYQTDSEKLLRHALYLSRITQCWYDNVSTTGSLHGRTFGAIRGYCNGFLDILEDYLEQGEDINLWN